MTGQLGIATDGNAIPVDYELSPIFKISYNILDPADKIIAFGYPCTEKIVNDTKTTFNFTGIWSQGAIIDYHPDGSPLVRNRCYQTSMKIDTGASGGPAFKNNYVVGLNSSGWDVEKHEEPLSYITPIDYLNDLSFEVEENIYKSVEELIKMKVIIAEPH